MKWDYYENYATPGPVTNFAGTVILDDEPVFVPANDN